MMWDQLTTVSYEYNRALSPHWEVTTIVYEKKPFNGHREISRQQDVAYRTTMDVGVAQAAQRALYALSYQERARPVDTYCRHTPYRASG
jgi:hypothetical protein